MSEKAIEAEREQAAAMAKCREVLAALAKDRPRYGTIATHAQTALNQLGHAERLYAALPRLRAGDREEIARIIVRLKAWREFPVVHADILQTIDNLISLLSLPALQERREPEGGDTEIENATDNRKCGEASPTSHRRGAGVVAGVLDPARGIEGWHPSAPAHLSSPPAPASEGETLPSHGALLADINKAAHASGTNAWVRDVLQRAHRAIRKSAPPVAEPLLADKSEVKS